MKAQILHELIDRSVMSHDAFARAESNRFRKFDSATPYGAHPVWCAMTILQEPLLEQKLRDSGAKVLLFHDVPEDTTDALPGCMLSTQEILWVRQMQFEGSAHKMREIWAKDKEVILFEIYDATNNYSDGAWMNEEKKAVHKAFILRLADYVEKEFGNLNIVRFARAIVA
ncbi:MAG TPA: hypothetical protein VGP13_03605 [Candidatus Paceibacterota bacterium]|jgi:hypothetical protein|nr:hypothetical protein [Candidatus Paceibacterota bacterium]